MKSIWSKIFLFLTILGGASFAGGQVQQCPLAGTYRIDIESSDKLYSVVRGATSRVPFGEQQQFFMDLSTRLTPPDIIAIECRGQRVSIASSRASRITFTADGITRREARPGGTHVNSRVELRSDALVFTSSGKADDTVNVSFEAVDNGRRMRVVRRIMSEQLDEPIVIRTEYDKVADEVNWVNFENPQIARSSRRSPASDRVPGLNPRQDSGSSEADILRSALDDWINATNRRDIPRQMMYYMPELRAYYLTRNTPREAVLREKQRIFANVRSVNITAEDPEIVFQDKGMTAIMRFHKKYKITDRARTRSGEVIQELRWQQTNNGWRIISERDIRVVR
jgi:ketosteroid isomerase-like protein